jgi:tRNA dimethylallyltransferase
MPASIKTAVLAIVGPTCTGKTDLSIELAQRFNGEIIALDSRTIYKKMDIGTAKPTTDQQNKIKHYAIDLTEPTRFFTVAEYIKVASEAIRIITSKGKLPILCGGTGLYARALLEGIQIPEIAPQEELRLQLNELANKNGNAALLSRLAELDSVAAGRLNLNDRRRIIRALEVCIVSGKPFSQIAIQGELPFQTTWIGLNWSDRDLHRRIISARLGKHLEEGLVEEVTELWKNEQYHEILSNSVNYKEFVPYIDKNKSLEEACAECVRSNFQLARKQMMWFRARSFINWITLENAYSMSDLLEKSIKMLPDYLLHN